MPAAPPTDSTRRFAAGLAALLAAVAFYAGLAVVAWSGGPLAQSPQGDARAWLALAQSLHEGTALREPFFRPPGYAAVLAGALESGLPQSDLADAARWLNLALHLAATALAAVAARRLWESDGAGWLAGALWGLYPPMIFFLLEPGPLPLAIALWMAGAAAALGAWRLAPQRQGGRVSRRHLWTHPFIAGAALAGAAALSAPWWAAALAWPAIALLLDPEGRGARVFSALAGVGSVLGGVMALQLAWGGSPQPLAGADLFRLSQGAEVTQPWAAPQMGFERGSDDDPADELEAAARRAYARETGRFAPGSAVLAGYWRQRAVASARAWPLKSGLRVVRKAVQFFAVEESFAGPSPARARDEIAVLRWNPLCWPLLLAAGGVGLALGWRRGSAWLLAGLGILASLGALAWHPTLDARLPVSLSLAILAGGCVAGLWPRNTKARLALAAAAALLFGQAWLPRPNEPGARLARHDARLRALAFADLGQVDAAIAELAKSREVAAPTLPDRELAAAWRFAQLLRAAPGSQPVAEVETQLLENAELALFYPSAQFRSGACLWMLGRADGALYNWRALALAADNQPWGAAARTAIARTGQETPEEALRRAAWEIGQAPEPPPVAVKFIETMPPPYAPEE